MRPRGEQPIDLEAFLAACRREVEVPADEATIRRVAAASGEVRYRTFTASSAELVAAGVVTAWDTDADRSRFIPTDAPRAEPRRAIALAELLASPALLAAKVAELEASRADRPARPTPRVITLHCARCDGRWLLDGNHGLLTICRAGAPVDVEVAEMTSPAWRPSIRACTCPSVESDESDG